MARAIVFTLAALAASLTPAGAAPVEIGAVYPTGGSHGRGGIDEYRGAALAVELANSLGGLRGQPVRLRLEQAESSDQAARAVDALARAGVPAILGSYGSTVSRPAAERATERGIVFWETGAVGELGMRALGGDRVFRFTSSGESLGRAAVAFARDVLLPRMQREPRSLRYAVTYVDDDYGRAVGAGALAELRRARLPLAGAFPYPATARDLGPLVSRVRAARTDVLFVSAYLSDGIELRRESIAQRLPLVASVGTSSSYCMHEFGEALGRDAVGLFASDKPDGHVLDERALSPGAARALRWARAEFARRYDHELTAPALTGFAGAWALVRHVLPRARALTPDAIADAARAVRLEQGALPNGSGMRFERGGVDNAAATSVIWQWVAPGERAVVWPPPFATRALRPLPIA